MSDFITRAIAAEQSRAEQELRQAFSIVAGLVAHGHYNRSSKEGIGQYVNEPRAGIDAAIAVLQKAADKYDAVLQELEVYRVSNTL